MNSVQLSSSCTERSRSEFGMTSSKGEDDDSMPRYGMVIDETKCVGCHACRVACQNQNHLLEKEAYNHLEEREYGTFPNYTREFLARSMPALRQSSLCESLSHRGLV